MHRLRCSGIFVLVTDLDLIIELDILPNCGRFQWDICNGCSMPTENAYSSEHVVLSHFGTLSVHMVRSISLELVLCLEFRVSNINNYWYFCFALNEY